MKLNAKELRESDEKEVRDILKKIKRNPIFFILENIYDTYNIGGLFRLADALAIEKMYLCGDMEIPPNSRIQKASIGTYKVVQWEYKQTAKEAIEELRYVTNNTQHITSNNEKMLHVTSCMLRVIAVEQHETAINYRKADYSTPIALIFGNETYGVLPDTLKLADQIVEIPMWGVNKSLNVIVSAAIVSYWLMSS